MDPVRLHRGLVNREERAWRVLIEEYGRLIYAVASRLGLDDAAREDLFQQACLAVFESIGTLRNPSRIASWLYTLTYRLGIDSLRRRRPEVGLEEVAPAAYSTQPDGGEPPILEELERVEAAAQVMDALAQIGQRCRRLLTALYLEEPRPSYEEISQRERMPIGSIGPTRARCLEKAGKIIGGLSNPG